MKKFRSFDEVFSNLNSHWVGNGFRVRQYFPYGKGASFMERFSPFIMLDYNPPHMFKGVANSKLGVGAHPHKGFETVTVVMEGYLEHGDSTGHSGVIGPGDVQWMTAGSGILHKEYHEPEYAKNDHMLHCVQLWVNLPAKDKLTSPKYQALEDKNMGKYNADRVSINIIAGEVLGQKGPASTFSPMNVYTIKLQKGAVLEIEEPGNFNTGLLIMNGQVNLNDRELNNGDFALFKNEEGILSFTGVADETDILVLSGEPLNEPVVAGGPFVMNTREELNQAIIDYNNGKFGSLDF